jgi:hypothetical protein
MLSAFAAAVRHQVQRRAPMAFQQVAYLHNFGTVFGASSNKDNKESDDDSDTTMEAVRTVVLGRREGVVVACPDLPLATVAGVAVGPLLRLYQRVVLAVIFVVGMLRVSAVPPRVDQGSAAAPPSRPIRGQAGTLCP